MAKALKYIYLTLGVLLSSIILWINLLLYAPAPPFPNRKQEVLHQLNFLSDALKKEDAGTKMQSFFPEGFVFIHALYGLAWCELSYSLPHDVELKQRAVKEALYAYKQISSEQGRSTFPQALQPAYGIFYTGWRNYLLAKLLGLQIQFKKRTTLTQEFKNTCESIAAAMRKSNNPFLESYEGQAWPADMFLAVASLKMHDLLYEPLYQRDLASWITQVKQRLDPNTGLLPHKAAVGTGNSIEGTRGGSMALMLRLLAEIDPDFAREQYLLFKQQFVTTILGLPAVREYPKNMDGEGDIDSGPVVLGVGFPATLVGIGTFQIFGDNALSKRQYQTVKAFGFVISKDEQSKYLLGKLPLADAFIAWSRASTYSVKPLEQDTSAQPLWRFPVHLISILVLFLIWFPFYRKVNR